MTTSEKAREVALRRRAQRIGLVLQRSRARRSDDPTHGLYRIGHLSARRLFVEETGWLTLDEADAEITRRMR